MQTASHDTLVAAAIEAVIAGLVLEGVRHIACRRTDGEVRYYANKEVPVTSYPVSPSATGPETFEAVLVACEEFEVRRIVSIGPMTAAARSAERAARTLRIEFAQIKVTP